MSGSQSKKMDDADLLQPLQQFCEAVTYCKTLGLYAYGLHDDVICLAMPSSEQIIGDSERGLIHTGAITTLIDSACGVAVLHALARKEPIATLDLRVDHLRSATSGELLICKARCYRITTGVAFVRADCYSKEGKVHIATAMASFMRLKAAVGTTK